MNNCPSCVRALQVPLHREYVKTCPGCGIRELAHMAAEERERMLDRLVHLCGPKARERVREELRVEMARIKKVRGARAKERV